MSRVLNAKCKVQNAKCKMTDRVVNALPDSLPPSFLPKAKNPPPSDREAKEASSERKLAKSQILTEGETDSPNGHPDSGGGHRPPLRCPTVFTLSPTANKHTNTQPHNQYNVFYNYFYFYIFIKFYYFYCIIVW